MTIDAVRGPASGSSGPSAPGLVAGSVGCTTTPSPHRRSRRVSGSAASQEGRQRGDAPHRQAASVVHRDSVVRGERRGDGFRICAFARLVA